MFSGTRLGLTHFFLAAFFSFVIQVAGMPAHAQSTGEIRIQVSDPSGAALQANGRVAGPGRPRFPDGCAGAYSLSGLAFGHYRVEISRAGFAGRVMTVDVNSTTPVSQAVTLRIQGASTSVTVLSPRRSDRPTSLWMRFGSCSRIDGKESRGQQCARPRGLDEQAIDQRVCERECRQPLPARHQLSRIYGLSSSGYAGRAFRLYGRCTPESALRRHRRLGSDS